ncbi:N-acyl homoserine lactonase family protein [Mucilaginibacter ginkgonis]|uniref:N-acyl homoserine lactonase family protein n=1 Tax=Mucilaginibacter ginkgonis TaxID=2682091 RepID=A0A6I4I1X2_9SPHI|nr:N-acyl homoserine lactonase family protein [Mucilaginibacter ginkgonis]QQL48821.1 N-acyl homoserine lactonase family protein [Mucilaginibacter ginkgonis]
MRSICLLAIFTFLFLLTATAQIPRYKVHAVKFAGTAIPFTVSDWALNGPKTKVDINFSVWVIKGDNGKVILFDTGFLKDAEDAADFKIKDYIRPDSALMKLGIKPGDVTDVIISHPHWDHIDGVSLFPNAHFWMQKEDYNYFVGQTWQKGIGSGGFAKRDVRKIVDLNLEGRLTLINGDDKQILPDIRVYTGSRHTFNSQYVVVNTGINKIVLASDNIWVYYSLQHLSPPSNGGTLDPAGYVREMKRMKTLASNVKFIIPGHDGKVFSIFPKVADGIVEIR